MMDESIVNARSDINPRSSAIILAPSAPTLCGEPASPAWPDIPSVPIAQSVNMPPPRLFMGVDRSGGRPSPPYNRTHFEPHSPTNLPILGVIIYFLCIYNFFKVVIHITIGLNLTTEPTDLTCRLNRVLMFLLLRTASL